jgi:PKD repeat protein
MLTWPLAGHWVNIFSVVTLVAGLAASRGATIVNNNGNGYAALDFNQSGGYTPPDSQGAAGPSVYVETVNQEIAVYSPKATGASATQSSLSTFLFTVGGLPRADANSGLSDPVVLYNDQIGRFIIGDQDVNSKTHVSRFDLAVSKTSTPATLTTADWNFYSIVTTESGFDADYPGNMGYNHDATVIVLNMFAVRGGGGRVQVLSVDNAALVAGTLTAYHNDLNDFNDRPTVMHSSAPGDPMWLVTEHGDSLSIDIIKVNNVLSSSATFTYYNIAVTAYSTFANPLNPNGTTITTDIDSRIQKAAAWNNILVAVHSVGVSTTQDVVQWYAFDISTGTPTLSQQGRVSGGANSYCIYPAIDINAAGNIGLTYMKSGTDTTTDYLSMYIAGRLSSDPAGTMQTPVLVPAGQGQANYSDFANPHRAGDLSGINVDPVDGSFWAVSEFANTEATANWGTAVANFTVSSFVASFTGGPTSGVAPLTVNFTNTSSGATNYAWTFGDGNTSTNANAVNTYSNAGTYSVTLTAIGAGGTNSLTRTNYVAVFAPVVAGFSGGPTSGVAPLAVTFTNLSSGATNYAWAFGDGNTSTNANPTNTYSSAGTYSVTLTAKGAGGTNSLTRTNYVVVFAPVVAGFSGGPTSGVAPLAVTFTNLSSGATNYAWAFGDGNTSTNANPTNTYSSAGTYSVTLTAIGAGGTNTLTRTNYVVVFTPVVAGFSGGPTSGVAPLAVTFTNSSSGATNYAWVFGDGNTSTNANPTNTYSSAGTYSVTLTAKGAGGTNTLTRTNYVVVFAPVVAGFSGGPTSGVAPLTVTFTNSSSGATNYAWAFGDGDTSTNANPVNTYSNAGAYSVTLTATGAGGTNSLTRTNYVVVFAPVVAGFSGGPTSGVAPLMVTFTNLSSGATNYEWGFGDGNTSTNANPVNTYSNGGTYSVTLAATGAGGSNTLTATNYIVVFAPVVAGFSGGPTSGVAPLAVTFTNSSSGATNYAWAFGDGNTSTDANPTNTYSGDGTYSVTLTAKGAGGTNTLTRTNYVVVFTPVVAGFSGGPTSGVAPLMVTFTNSSSGATDYAWALGDGNTSTDVNPVNTYSNAGAYSVTLTATGAGGSNTLTATNYVVVFAPVVANFSGGPTSGVAPLLVTFTNLSSGGTNYAWAFGDGNTSTNANPVNTYSNAGTYSVTLTVAGPGGSSTLVLTNYITATLPTPLPDQLLVAPVLLSDGSFQFAISNVDGTPITTEQQSRMAVFATTDLLQPLTNWTLLTNTTWLTNGLLQITDPDRSSFARKYYRSLQRP